MSPIGRVFVVRANRTASAGGRAMPYFATTVTIQRLSLLDLSSFTEQTNPVTGDPMSINVAFWPLYWA
jgi:hypothetical protein